MVCEKGQFIGDSVCIGRTWCEIRRRLDAAVLIVLTEGRRLDYER